MIVAAFIISLIKFFSNKISLGELEPLIKVKVMKAWDFEFYIRFSVKHRFRRLSSFSARQCVFIRPMLDLCYLAYLYRSYKHYRIATCVNWKLNKVQLIPYYPWHSKGCAALVESISFSTPETGEKTFKIEIYGNFCKAFYVFRIRKCNGFGLHV